MKEYNEPIPFEGEFKNAIAAGIVDGMYLFREHLNSERFLTVNGREMYLWNYINRAISNKLPRERFQVVIMHRGVWQFLGIYDKNTKYLYTLMRNDNFKRLQSEAMSHRFHYLNSLSGINEPLKEEYDVIEEQLCLFPDLAYNDKESESLEKVLEKLIMQIEGEIKLYALITFTTAHEQVVAFKSIITARGMDLFYEEDWEQWIVPNYDILENEWAESEVESTDIMLQRKPELVRLKKRRKEEA